MFIVDLEMDIFPHAYSHLGWSQTITFAFKNYLQGYGMRVGKNCYSSKNLHPGPLETMSSAAEAPLGRTNPDSHRETSECGVWCNVMVLMCGSSKAWTWGPTELCLHSSLVTRRPWQIINQPESICRMR